MARTKTAKPKHRELNGSWIANFRWLRLEIIGDVPESPNVLRYKHWRTAHGAKKKWYQRIAVCVANSRLPGRPPCDHQRVKVTIRQYRRRTLDPDNLVASVKPILDGLQEADVIRDDAAPYLELEVFQCNRPKHDKPVATEITVKYH